ncbi:MAG: TlpA family protein disulfide reductase [Caulobacterales bacterium]|nr:TlpA family protein disulfide reductase [Caulobacterales bacterium]MCA0373476.1 TlpA family protein disulfide reductase [Pseudomonadota bacterium]
MKIINRKYITIISIILFGSCFSAPSYSEGKTVKITPNKPIPKKSGLSILIENKIEIIGKNSPFIRIKDKTTIPNIEIFDSNSKIVKLNDIVKSKSAIHFWDTNCAPCLAEMEEFVNFAQKYETKYAPVIFISLDEDDKREYANKKFAELTKGRFKSYYFKTVPQKDAFYGHFMPQTIFYDKNKRETARGVSAKHYAEDSEAIFKYLEKMQ